MKKEKVIKVISAETKSLSKVSANIPTIQIGSAEDLTKYIDSVKSLQELSRTTSSVPTANINGETFSDLSKQVAKYRDELGQVTTATEYYNKEGNLVAVNNESLNKKFYRKGFLDTDTFNESVKGFKKVNIQVKELGESKIIDGTMFREFKNTNI